MLIAENIERVRARIDQTCRKAGRSLDEVTLIAVTKTVGISQIEKALAAGITSVGENRVQEAWTKYNQVEVPADWHLIGHLQTNKVKRALQFANMIHSVDSIRLARELQVQAERLDRTIDVLVQVNTSQEESKFGFEPEETEKAVDEIADFSGLTVKGLMTIGAFTDVREQVRACFRLLRGLRDRIASNIPRVSLDELSMGMTNDYDIAIEEGATMVRIGRSIFGKRN